MNHELTIQRLESWRQAVFNLLKPFADPIDLYQDGSLVRWCIPLVQGGEIEIVYVKESHTGLQLFSKIKTYEKTVKNNWFFTVGDSLEVTIHHAVSVIKSDLRDIGVNFK